MQRHGAERSTVRKTFDLQSPTARDEALTFSWPTPVRTADRGSASRKKGAGMVTLTRNYIVLPR